jgi:hypothetical protein
MCSSCFGTSSNLYSFTFSSLRRKAVPSKSWTKCLMQRIQGRPALSHCPQGPVHERMALVSGQDGNQFWYVYIWLEGLLGCLVLRNVCTCCFSMWTLIMGSCKEVHIKCDVSILRERELVHILLQRPKLVFKPSPLVLHFPLGICRRCPSLLRRLINSSHYFTTSLCCQAEVPHLVKQ